MYCSIRPLVLSLFMISSCQQCCSQQYFYNEHYYENNWLLEWGAGAGWMNCLTDLGGTREKSHALLKDLVLANSKNTFGFSATLTNNYWLSIRFDFLHGSIEAKDSDIKNAHPLPGSRRLRNLQFKSVISELSIRSEIYPAEISVLIQNKPFLLDLISPCLIIGIGYFSFDPITIWEGQRIRLHPLRTEGQGFPEYPGTTPYQLRQWNIPAGIGLRCELSALLTLKMEGLYRILFTDYLDDVSRAYIDPELFEKYLSAENSTRARLLADRSKEIIPGVVSPSLARRGNSTKNDSYLNLQLQLSVALNRKRRN